MQPTSVKGTRRQISRKIRAGKPIPQWMLDNLDGALDKAGKLPHYIKVKRPLKTPIQSG